MIEQIIGVGGSAGAGKSTLCKVASNFFGFQHLEMADPLRKIAAVFQADGYGYEPAIDYADLHLALVNAGYILDAHETTIGLNKILAMFDMVNEYRETKSVHDRAFVQFLGTEVMRHLFGENVHCNAVWSNLQPLALPKKLIIGSIRFQNEYDFWKSKAIKYSQIIIDRKTPQLNHISEVWYRSFSGEKTIIKNDGSMADFVKDCAYTIQNI
jgi:hypothetical protein